MHVLDARVGDSELVTVTVLTISPYSLYLNDEEAKLMMKSTEGEPHDTRMFTNVCSVCQHRALHSATLSKKVVLFVVPPAPPLSLSPLSVFRSDLGGAQSCLRIC